MTTRAPAVGADSVPIGDRRTRAAFTDAARVGIPAGIVVLAGILRLTQLGAVTPNPYYDAAVRTMSLSWHNALYGLFAPGSGVAIDKPPVDLALQVASTKLLGFTTPALLLPEALAGTLAVFLLFDLLRTLFGWAAGVAGALTLAVLPVAVITSRSDTMDSVMCALILASAALVARAARGPGRGWPRLLAAAALYGLAFEVKLLEALVALPALLTLFWLAAPGRPAARLRALAAMTGVFLAVALSWLTLVSLAPGGARPWYLGSTNGSPWNATFVYNGIDRITGGGAARVPPAATGPSAAAHRVALRRRPAAAGPARLLAPQAALGPRIGITLVAAWAALLLAIALGAWSRLPRTGRAGLAALGVWLLTGTLLFSAMRRLETRYLEAFTPAVAGALGTGLVLSARMLGERWGARRAWAGAAVAVLALVLALPGATSVSAAGRGVSDSGRPGWMSPARVLALSTYLRAHQGTARFEFASLSPAKAGPLVVRDARPVMILTSQGGRGLVGTGTLASAVRAGDVRYALVGATCSPRSSNRLTGCSAQARWIRAHGTDVSRAAGQPHRGLLYRLTATAHARGRGRTPRSATSSSTSSATAPSATRTASHAVRRQPGRAPRRRRDCRATTRAPSRSAAPRAPAAPLRCSGPACATSRGSC